MEEPTTHQPILVDAVLTAFEPVPGKLILDGTFGGGGHSRALLGAGASVIALDRDPAVGRFAQALREEFGQRFRFEALPYEEADRLSKQFDGVLLDLGVSSDQLASLGRGFSFQDSQAPLDLCFNPVSGQTAAGLLAQSSQRQLEEIFGKLAEDRYAGRLSRKVVERRRQQPIRTVGDLIEVIGTRQPKVLAPIWQALRLSVNDELGHLRRGLESIHQALKPGGVLAALSFHSLEDRIVKNFLRENGYELLTKKPIVPGEDELQANPRSRSAKFRAGKKAPSAKHQLTSKK